MKTAKVASNMKNLRPKAKKEKKKHLLRKEKKEQMPKNPNATKDVPASAATAKGPFHPS